LQKQLQIVFAKTKQLTCGINASIISNIKPSKKKHYFAKQLLQLMPYVI